jgi:polyribonucleotide nucleotidyltransferase
VGSLIGAKGANLEDIFRNTGCRVNVGPETGTDSRLVFIEGSDVSQMSRAADMVNKKLTEWLSRSGGQYPPRQY